MHRNSLGTKLELMHVLIRSNPHQVLQGLSEANLSGSRDVVSPQLQYVSLHHHCGLVAGGLEEEHDSEKI